MVFTISPIVKMFSNLDLTPDSSFNRSFNYAVIPVSWIQSSVYCPSELALSPNELIAMLSRISSKQSAFGSA